ncbi:MAG TPA: condensation domain-containing protein, partial [Longimicrobiaceae bacterium]|nr:condensation domain-containing protein [Longimicrobiaceae bacterium]
MNPNAIEDFYPLSPMQEGMLFHTLFEPGSDLYLNQYAFRIRGVLDEAALRRAWQGVVARHPVLRTAFAWEKVERPLQVVRAGVELPWETVDWRGEAGAAGPARLETLLAADRARAFELNRAPLMRITLARSAERAWYMVWSHHHLLLDAWSGPLVLREVFALYRAEVEGRPAELPPTRPFRDYVAWLERQDLAGAEAYWRRTLAGLAAATVLGVERSGGRGVGEMQAGVPAAATARLRMLARERRLTLGTLVQGAWALLLGRYSGSGDVVFGATVSGRPPELAGVEEMVGLFINTLPVRVAVDPAAPVLGWLEGIQAGQAELREFEYSPLAQVQKWSEVPAGQPLFEQILVVNTPGEEGADEPFAGIMVEPVRAVEKTNYPLTVEARTGARITFHVEYDRARFEDGAAERLLEHLARLLEGLGSGAGLRLGEVEMLDEAERRQLLREWNDTARPLPSEDTVDALVGRRAAGAPGAPAVVFGRTVLGYRELDARASRLAHALRRRGVGPEARVGICLERSAEMVVALLGVLRAGGACVPLDPGYPDERLAWMLEDSGASLVLADGRSAGRFGAGAGVVDMDAER